MARIIFGTYMVRYPLGGMLSWALQWVVGLSRLGHEVFVVEKGGYAQACFDPERGTMTDDCTNGLRCVRELLAPFGLADKLCYVDVANRYHGLDRVQVEAAFAAADLFLDVGTHGAWLPEAAPTPLRVLVDQEPGYRQIKWVKDATVPHYNRYYTNGLNIGAAGNSIPTHGLTWGSVVNPVLPELFPFAEPPPGAPFTTVMNWQSHEALEFDGLRYGQKDVAFNRFLALPSLVEIPLEIAVGGRNPGAELVAAGWRLRDGHAATRTVQSYREFIRASAGEFGIAKHVFIATRSGWFSDRSAAYLASGRPVVAADTGFGDHIPCGRGVFAVRSAKEAAEAIAAVIGDWPRHSGWARELAHEFFAAPKVLSRFLAELGV